METVKDFPGAIVRWLDGMSGRTKALVAGGGAAIITGALETILMALVAACGIGVMPPEADIQGAIVLFLMSVGIGVGVSTAPNSGTTPVSEPEDTPIVIVETPEDT